MQLFDELTYFFNKNPLRYKIILALLYGSQAEGLARRDSDVDIAVVFNNEVISADDMFLFITEISYALSRQLGREVNVISIDRDFSHPMLYYNAIVLGRPIFISDNDKYLKIVLEAIYQMEDFQIFGIQWQREAARKNMEGFGYAGI